MRLTLEGDDKLRAFLKSRPGKAAAALGGALWMDAEEIMRRSKDEFVPVDLGALRGSGYVEEPEIKGTKVSVELGYGGVAGYREAIKAGIPADRAQKVPGYALIQHEATHFHHPGQGEAKYLEKPVLQAHQGFDQRVARRMKRRLERP